MPITLRRLLCLSLTALTIVGATTMDVVRPFAQTRPEEAPAAAGLTPYPESDVYRLQTYGDAFAEGLNGGLSEVFVNAPRVQIQRKHKSIGALVRAEWEDDIKLEEAAKETVHVGVLMLGLMDRQVIRPNPGVRPFSIGSDEWRDEYAKRIDRVLRALKKRGMVLYMVGQPVLRNATANTHAEMINEIMRQRASANGVRFIDIFEQFQDDGGAFTQFGPDVTGNRVKLREGDGLTFTPTGYKQLAYMIEKDVRRDIDQAAMDRAIPLAGDESEQRRVNPARAVGGANQPAGWKGAVTIGGQAKAAQPQAPAAASAGEQSGDQKSDNGRVTVRTIAANGREETATIEILRPAIRAEVIALVTRRDAALEKSVQPGEAVVEEIGGGLTVVNSVSVLGDGTSAATRRRASPSQLPYYMVLRGERLTPRPGRADDFSWPRQDSVLPQPAPAGLGPAAGPGQPTNRPGAISGPTIKPAPAGQPALQPRPKT